LTLKSSLGGIFQGTRYRDHKKHKKGVPSIKKVRPLIFKKNIFLNELPRRKQRGIKDILVV